MAKLIVTHRKRLEEGSRDHLCLSGPQQTQKHDEAMKEGINKWARKSERRNIPEILLKQYHCQVTQSLDTARETCSVFPGTNMGQRSFAGEDSDLGRSKDVCRAKINP